jgi:peptide/nickel transport system ATP-binding protein
MVQLFADLRASTNAAMLFISHNIGLVAQVCERIAVMYAGEIVDSGPTLQVLSGPTHPYTRALLSSIIPLGATKHDLTLASLEGSAPRGEVRGCAFSPRCVMATPQCETDHPALIAVDAERSSRCWCQSGPMSLEAGTRLSLTPETTPMATDAVLEVRGLSKTFEQGERQVAAVVDVSFSVSRGRILGVVGESGCGKTTMARIVAGLSEASEGHVILDGTDATRLVQHRPNEMRRLVQMVFQDPDATLNPKHTVRRALRRTVRRLTDLRGEALERRVEEVARAMRLEPDQVDSLPSQLSGGQQQRAALARAFASDPDLILCDEPTSALDVSVQAAILNLIVDLQRKRDASYMFISHDLAAVRYVADDMAVMYLGGIVEIGPASRVFTPPVHPYTEVLLSATVMTERIKLPNVEMTLGSRPTGCPFHPRCPRKVGPECETALPPWQATDNAHRYRCVIAPGELKKAQAMFNLSASSMPGPPGPDALI